MKMHFGYDSITVNQRGAHDMAAVAKPRITRAKLKCGDLIFFGPKGPASSVNSIYHAALYLGHGWFIQSTGSTDGVSLASLNNSSYWKAAFAWGRRVLTPAELVVPSPSASPAPAAEAHRRRSASAASPERRPSRRPLSLERAMRGRCHFAPAADPGLAVSDDCLDYLAMTNHASTSPRLPAALIVLLLAVCVLALLAGPALAAAPRRSPRTWTPQAIVYHGGGRS